MNMVVIIAIIVMVYIAKRFYCALVERKKWVDDVLRGDK